MKYLSTRADKTLCDLKQAAFKGLAADGGLFMPEQIPHVDMNVLMTKAEKSFPEMAYYLASLFFGDDISEADLQDVGKNAFTFPIPLKHLGDNRYTLELFHGPTFAFTHSAPYFRNRRDSKA